MTKFDYVFAKNSHWIETLQADSNHNLRISKTEAELAKMGLSETNGGWEETDAADDIRRSRKRLSEALEVLQKNSEEMREKHDFDANWQDGSGDQDSSWGISKFNFFLVYFSKRLLIASLKTNSHISSSHFLSLLR